MASLRTNVPLTIDRLSTLVRVDSAIPTVRSDLRSVCPHAEHNTNPDMLHLKYICDICGQIDKPAKARKTAAGWQVADSDQVKEAREAAAEPFKTAISVAVHPADSVTTQMIESGKAYWLAPDKFPENYAVITDTVRRHPELAFLTRFAVRSAVTTYRLVVRDDALMIAELLARTATRPAPKVPELNESGQRWANVMDAVILPDVQSPFNLDELTLPDPTDAAFGPTIEGTTPTVPSSTDALLAMLEAEVKKGNRKTARTTRPRASRAKPKVVEPV